MSLTALPKTSKVIATVRDVVFVVEDSALNGTFIQELYHSYIVPAVQQFTQDQNQSFPWALSECTYSFTLVLFRTSDYPGLSAVFHGPFSSGDKFLQSFRNLKFAGGGGDLLSFGVEGLAQALSVLDELGKNRGTYLNPDCHQLKYIIYVANSVVHDLPVADVPEYENASLSDLTGLICDRGIQLSVLSGRRIPFLCRLFVASGGNLDKAKKSKYSKHPSHLVLLQGFQLPNAPSDAFLAPSSLQQPQQSLAPIQPQAQQTVVQRPQVQVQQTSQHNQVLQNPQLLQHLTQRQRLQLQLLLKQQHQQQQQQQGQNSNPSLSKTAETSMPFLQQQQLHQNQDAIATASPKKKKLFHSIERMIATPASAFPTSQSNTAPVKNSQSANVPISQPSVTATQPSLVFGHLPASVSISTVSPIQPSAATQHSLPFSIGVPLQSNTVSQQKNPGSNMKLHLLHSTAVQASQSEKCAKSSEVSTSKPLMSSSVVIIPTNAEHQNSSTLKMLPSSSVAITPTNVISHDQKSSLSKVQPPSSVSITPTNVTSLPPIFSTSTVLPSSNVLITPTNVTTQDQNSSLSKAQQPSSVSTTPTNGTSLPPICSTSKMLPSSSVAITPTNVTSQDHNSSLSKAQPPSSVSITPTSVTSLPPLCSTSKVLPSSNVLITPTNVTSQHQNSYPSKTLLPSSVSIMTTNVTSQHQPSSTSSVSITTSEVTLQNQITSTSKIQPSSIVAISSTNETPQLPQTTTTATSQNSNTGISPHQIISVPQNSEPFTSSQPQEKEATSQSVDASSSQASQPETGLERSAVNQPGLAPTAPMVKSRSIIWTGQIKWFENNNGCRLQQTVKTGVSCLTYNRVPEVSAHDWPAQLTMHLLSKDMLKRIGQNFLQASRSVIFHPEADTSVQSLFRLLSPTNGSSGCIYFNEPGKPVCELKVLILLCNPVGNSFLGFIPNEQNDYVSRLRQVIQEETTSQRQRLINSRQAQLQGQEQRGVQVQQDCNQPPPQNPKCKQQNNADSSSTTLPNMTTLTENVQKQDVVSANPVRSKSLQHQNPLKPNEQQQPEQTKTVNKEDIWTVQNCNKESQSTEQTATEQKQQPMYGGHSMSGLQPCKSQSFTMGQAQIRLPTWQPQSATPQPLLQQQHQEQLNRIVGNQMQKNPQMARGYTQIRPQLRAVNQAPGSTIKLETGSFQPMNNNQPGLGPDQAAKTGADVINYLIARGTLQAGPDHQHLVNQQQQFSYPPLHSQQPHSLGTQQQFGVIQMQQEPQQSLTSSAPNQGGLIAHKGYPPPGSGQSRQVTPEAGTLRQGLARKCESSPVPENSKKPRKEP